MIKAAVLFAMLAGVAFAAPGDGGISGGGATTNVSGTITSGSTSQVVMTAKTNRSGCEIQTLTADMWVAIDRAASNANGSYYLPAGSLFRCPNPVPTGAISVWSTTAGAGFTALEFTR